MNRNLLIPAILAAIISLSSVGVTAAQVTEEEDEFTGSWSATTERVDLEHSSSHDLAAAMFVMSESRAFMHVFFLQNGWMHRDSSTARFIVDDDRFTKEEVHSTHEALEGRDVLESFVFLLTPEEVENIGHASDVRFRITGQVYEVPQKLKDAALEAFELWSARN